jgi:phosphatidate phosphatase APP1
VGIGDLVAQVERRLELRRARSDDGPPAHFRIEPYLGHAGSETVVVRGRVLDNPPPAPAELGESVGAAVRRTVRLFRTVELPGAALRVSVGDASADVVSDDDGYFRAEMPATPGLSSPWSEGLVQLVAPYRGHTEPHPTRVEVRVPGPDAAYGVLSDVDDTVLETGVERVGRMLVRTFTGSALTRTPFPGAAQLYRDLAAGGANPFFYVSSSPWNLHPFLVDFLTHRDFPLGPVLLRDLLGTPRAGREQKHGRIREVLRAHPQLPFVLIGDSGERDPEIYADIVAEFPGRVRAVYIREVRSEPDGRFEAVRRGWPPNVPLVLAAHSDDVRRHATTIGLL